MKVKTNAPKTLPELAVMTKRIAAISLVTWMIFRLLFHMFSFENSDILRFLYFGGNDMAVIGFLLLLKDYFRGFIERLIKVCLTYAAFCLVADILMLMGIGAHDYWLFTAISISILALGGIWLRYV